MIDQAELEELGFRWKERTSLQCRDGSTITVEPSVYMSSRENQGSGERFRKALRLYTVVREDETREDLVSELDIEQRLEIDWQAKRDRWLTDVRQLLAQIGEWGREEGWLVQEQEKQLSEDYIGTYTAPTLFIQMPSGRIHIDPVGVNIIGGDGRVDILAFPELTRMLLIRFGDTWRLKTDSRVDWPQPWGKTAFMDLARALSDTQ